MVPYTGAVGCKLYYPGTNRLQHAGVLNLPIGPGHCLYGSEDHLNYYYGRNILDYNFTAVTGACLMVSKKKFNEIGGFDEELPVAYNDVSLCFSLVEAGYYNVLRNDVSLVHHESISRGRDDASAEKEERRKREMAKLYERHPMFANGYDPCYNPNLTPDKGDFSFNTRNSQKPATVKEIRPDLYKLTDDIVFNIENLAQTEDTVRFSGWAYDSSKKNNNHIKTKILLQDATGKTFEMNTIRLYRFDVATPDGRRRGLGLTGFETYFIQDAVPAGIYRVGIVINKKIKMTERTIILSDRR